MLYFASVIISPGRICNDRHEWKTWIHTDTAFTPLLHRFYTVDTAFTPLLHRFYTAFPPLFHRFSTAFPPPFSIVLSPLHDQTNTAVIGLSTLYCCATGISSTVCRGVYVQLFQSAACYHGAKQYSCRCVFDNSLWCDSYMYILGFTLSSDPCILILSICDFRSGIYFIKFIG